ncbi:hypothetical protein ACFQJ3_06115 [Salinibaculum sp. GCM10025337]|uniref:hypothetical protein n=1 Tax=Salinibaculum sp. GCM10025337 TaxID=3252686 RepID=UPI00361ADF16
MEKVEVVVLSRSLDRVANVTLGKIGGRVSWRNVLDVLVLLESPLDVKERTAPVGSE